MDLRVDHVTVAGSDLDALTARVERGGLAPAYGGEHSSGATEMAAVGFPDGSYLELVGPVGEEPAPFWDRPIRADAGPCAWAVHVGDLGAAVERLRDRGIAVEGPRPLSRERPDGTHLSWSMAFPGPGEPGSQLPFLIADDTPREARARPGQGSEGTGLTGVERVVVGVADLGAAVERYRTAFGVAEPTRHDADGIRVARVPDAPVDLATAEEGWLADRLDRFGPLPCAFLLGADDDAAARGRAAAGDTGTWLGREVAWLDVTGGGIGDLGVLL